jgi:isopentenyl phosphate kinase
MYIVVNIGGHMIKFKSPEVEAIWKRLEASIQKLDNEIEQVNITCQSILSKQLK